MFRNLAIAGALALGLAGCISNPFASAPVPAAPVVAQAAPAKTIIQTVQAKAVLDNAHAVAPAPAAPSLGYPTLPQPQAVAPTKVEATFNVPAQAPTQVVLPVGSWFDVSLQFILAALGGVTGIVALVRSVLPAGLGLIAQYLLPGLLNRGIAAAHNMIPGVQLGDTVSVPVGNTIAATALQWIVDHGPALVIKFAGGPDKIAEHVKALIPLVREAGDPALAVPAPAADPVSAVVSTVTDAIESVVAPAANENVAPAAPVEAPAASAAA